MPPAKEISQKDARRYKRELEKLSLNVLCYIHLMDEVCKQPQSYERGKRIAKLMNDLEYLNDSVRLFVLYLPSGKEDKRKAFEKAKRKAKQ